MKNLNVIIEKNETEMEQTSKITKQKTSEKVDPNEENYETTVM